MKQAAGLLGRHTLIYGIGSAISAAASFLLIPLYTKALSVADYGVLEVLNRTADVLVLIVFLGVRQAFIRFFFEREDEEWKKAATATTLAVVGGSCLLAAVVFYPLADWISRTLLEGKVEPALLQLLILWIPGECVYSVGMAYLQVRMKSLAFLVCSTLRLGLVVGSNFYFLYALEKGVWGAMATNIWVTAAFGLAFAAVLLRWTRGAFSPSLARELLLFGLPFLPASFFAYIVNNADRFFLARHASMEAVGLYSLAFKLGMFGTMLVMEPFSRVWAPIVFEHCRKEGGARLIGEVFALFAGVLATAALGTSFFAPVVIPLIATEAYADTWRLVPLLSAAACFYSLSCLADAGILIAKKTKFKPLVFGACAAVSVGLNLLLTPRWGAWGAAVALLAAFVVMLALNHTLSARYFRMEIPGRKIAALVFAVVVAFGSWLVLGTLEDGWGWRLARGLAGMGIYAILLWRGGFFAEGDRERLWAMTRKGAGKG